MKRKDKTSGRICGTRLNPIGAYKSWICLLPKVHEGPCESNIDVIRQREPGENKMGEG